MKGFCGRQGFSLTEVLVAVALLLLFSVAAVPLFISNSEGAQASRIRFVALELAGGVLEKARSLPYDQVGVVGGDPAGVLPASEKISQDGVNYEVRTDVKWVDDPRDGVANGDKNPKDYKQVSAIVTAKIFSGRVPISVRLDTLVSKEKGAE